MATISENDIQVAELEKDKDDNSEFIASVITNAFKETFNTTQNPNDWNLKHIYTGGYSPLTGPSEQAQTQTIDFSTNMLTASAQVVNPNISNQNANATVFVNGEEIVLNDIVARAAMPYTKGLRRRFINALMSDPVIGTVFGIITFYVFNVERKSVIKPIGDNRTKNSQELNDILEEIIPSEIQDGCINYLDDVDTYSRVWDWYAPLSFQHMLTHGTGGFFKELINNTGILNEELGIEIPIGTPAVLKELDPMYFEKVFIHRKTFGNIFLEYTDQGLELIDDEIFNNPKIPPEIANEFKGWKQLIIRDPTKNTANAGKNLMLPVNQMVIFRNQMNIAPNVSFFGVSKLFSILPISEIQRELNYNVIPSVNKVQSQGSCIINTKIRSEAKNKQLVGQLKQGTNYIVTNSEGLDVKNIAINVDLAGLAKERFDNVLMEIMGLNYPSPLINFEGVTNRATMDSVLTFFQNTSLEGLRDIVSTAMNDQWYIPNMMFFFNYVLPQSKVVNESKREAKKWNYANLKLKIVTEFEKLDFSSLTDKLTALNPVTFLNDTEKREYVGKDPEIDDPEAENIEKVNTELKEIEEVNANPMRAEQDKNKEVEEIKNQMREMMEAIKDPKVKQLMMQRMADRNLSL